MCRLPWGEKFNGGPTVPRYGMVIDLDLCTGCRACETACMAENNVPFPESLKDAEQGRTISWMRILPKIEGEFSDIQVTFTPLLCMQCDNPPCTRVCPVGATYLSKETGIVGQIYGRCIGCRYCANACPYSVKYFNWARPAWPAPMDESLNPDMAVRPKGVIEKCTFCHHRLQIAKEAAAAAGRPLSEKDYQVACGEACPTRAIVFGDLDNPSHEVQGLQHHPRAVRLMEDLGTQPKVIYLAKAK